jgi:hypothetical protein
LDLKHIRLLAEDDSTWHVQDGRDGSSFKVAKKGLSEGLHGAIVQHFAGGGEVQLEPGVPLQARINGIDSELANFYAKPYKERDQSVHSRLILEREAAQRAGIRAGVAAAANQSPSFGPKEPTFLDRFDEAYRTTPGGPAPQALPGPGDLSPVTRQTLADLPGNLAATAKDVGRDALSALGVGAMGPAGASYLQNQAAPSPQPPSVAPGSPPLPGAAPSPTTAPAPSRPPGVGGGGFGAELAGATKQAIGAETQRALLAGTVGEAQNAIQRDAQVQRQAIQQEWSQKWQQNQARADQLQQELATGKMDPARWWSTRDLGGKVAASIALVLGGIGEAFNGGPNQALKVINNFIERDIDAQKTDLGKKQNLLSHYVQQGHDIQSAMQLAKADAMDAYAGQMQMVASKYAGPEARVNAEKAIAGIKGDAAKLRENSFIQRAKLAIDQQEANAKMLAAANSGAGRVPAKEAADVGGLKAANAMLADLERLRKQKTGALSGVTQYLPGTDATQYRDATRVVAQTVGNILEGGKLSDADKPYYLSLLPTAGDSDERARAKLDFITRQLETKAAGQVEGLGRAGYNTGGLQGMAQQPVQNPTGPSRVINGKTYVPTAQGWVEQ